MATTYKSVEVTAGDVPRAVTPGVYSVYGHYAAVGSSLVINDVVQMCKVPLGARVLGIALESTDLDSGATPAVTLSIGDGDDTDRFIANSTVGQAGGVVAFPTGTGFNTAGMAYQYTTNDTIDILVGTAPQTTATTFTFKMTVLLSIDN